MPDPQPITVPKNAKLAEVNKIVAQTEGNLGPLMAMGIEGDRTILQFDLDEEPPDENAIVVPDVAGMAVPAGSSKVCTGEIFIEGKKTPSTAYRKT